MENIGNKRGNGFDKVRWTLPSDFVGISLAAQAVRRQIDLYAHDRMGTTVLITGERGTGKAVVSSVLHAISVYVKRREVYVCRNCSCFSGDLASSELFGHCRGAFTDAHASRDGCFMAAENGTLFLDEIGTMSLSLQAMLLLAIENRVVKPLGNDRVVPYNARLHVATNCDLQLMCSANNFRSDLYDRLSVMHIHIPPLRSRMEDIRPLAQAFVKRWAAHYGLNPAPKIDEDVFSKLHNYHFSGNVRELENMIQMAVFALSQQSKRKSLCSDDIIINACKSGGSSAQQPDIADKASVNSRIIALLDKHFDDSREAWQGKSSNTALTLFDLPGFEKELMQHAYKLTGKKKSAAKLLGIDVGKYRENKKNEK